ncbi:major facilitator superfamily domain-containing protein [Lipomyces kononenkoae]
MIVLGCSFGYLNAFGSVATNLFRHHIYQNSDASSIYETYYKQNQLRDKSPATIAWIGSLQVFSQFGSDLFAGAFFDKYGARVSCHDPCQIIYVFSMMMTSFCKEYYQFILAQGILGGLGVGFLFAPAMNALAHYFMRKRGIAIGIAAGGSSIGGVLFPIALRSALYSRLGFGWGVRVIAFVVLALLCIASVLVKERLPHRHVLKCVTGCARVRLGCAVASS